MQYYNENEITQIVKNSAKILNIQITDEAALEIAKRSRFTPRTANYLLKRCRDYAQVNKAIIDIEVVNNTLTLLEIDNMGLGVAERMLLNTLVNIFPDKPVGLNTLSASIGEEESTLEDVVEPYLLQIGFIERTTRGRVATEKAKEHIKKLEDNL